MSAQQDHQSLQQAAIIVLKKHCASCLEGEDSEIIMETNEVSVIEGILIHSQ